MSRTSIDSVSAIAPELVERIKPSDPSEQSPARTPKTLAAGGLDPQQFDWGVAPYLFCK
jgi:hypothetical protein